MLESITIGVSLEYIEVVRLMAKLESLKATSAAMHAANSARVKLGAALAYGEDQFAKLGDELDDIERRLFAISEAKRQQLADEQTAAAEQPQPAEQIPQAEG